MANLTTTFFCCCCSCSAQFITHFVFCVLTSSSSAAWHYCHVTQVNFGYVTNEEQVFLLTWRMNGDVESRRLNFEKKKFYREKVFLQPENLWWKEEKPQTDDNFLHFKIISRFQLGNFHRKKHTIFHLFSNKSSFFSLILNENRLRRQQWMSTVTRVWVKWKNNKSCLSSGRSEDERKPSRKQCENVFYTFFLMPQRADSCADKNSKNSRAGIPNSLLTVTSGNSLSHESSRLTATKTHAHRRQSTTK